MTTFEADLLNSLNKLHYNQWLPIFNVCLSIVSALLIFWYAWEARRNANEMKTQNALQVLPFLTITTETNNQLKDMNSPDTLIVNIGKGIALNINFKTINFSQDRIPDFRNVEILKPSEKIIITMKEGFILPLGSAMSTGLKAEIVANFEDILGNRYSQTIKIDNLSIMPIIPQQVKRVS